MSARRIGSTAYFTALQCYGRAVSVSNKCILFSDHRSCLEEEQNLFIDVDCRHPEAILTPMPEGLSQQQVGRGCWPARPCWLETCPNACAAGDCPLRAPGPSVSSGTAVGLGGPGRRLWPGRGLCGPRALRVPTPE